MNGSERAEYALDRSRLHFRPWEHYIRAELQQQGRRPCLWRINASGHSAPRGSCVTQGYVAFLARFPEHRLSVAVLCNAGYANPNKIAHAVADGFLPKHLPTSQAAQGKAIGETHLQQPLSERWQPTLSELRPFVGRFQSDEVGAVYVTSIENSRLVLRLERDPSKVQILNPTSRDTFVFAGGSVPRQHLWPRFKVVI